ncbi:NUDIX domain-containing protein [Reichenbachiella agarivorans]|uniref:NUDIX domain-containing protein n=1 Tax=Reichenbachiella agarivorans TaxID=2979464 RepID=A0ABY6CL95_9BACT|nr:NUDIX domain-containing protein [Reichenbachiella agarivorans]UXP31297.1 NUDIX domain-containing protein [Reichenbachiella agarivorans]
MREGEIKSIFGNKVRVRVMGLFRRDNQILLINHRGLNTHDELWLPPGGGVDFGVGIEETLRQEFKEELNVEITVGDFLFLSEFRSLDYHAIELFFEIKTIKGDLKLGLDPELEHDQILQEWQFWSFDQINKIPQNRFHAVFQNLRDLDELFCCRGFFNVGNIV